MVLLELLVWESCSGLRNLKEKLLLTALGASLFASSTDQASALNQTPESMIWNESEHGSDVSCCVMFSHVCPSMVQTPNMCICVAKYLSMIWGQSTFSPH